MNVQDKPLFNLVQSSENRNSQTVLSPERALVDYAKLRETFPHLPTSVFAADRIKPAYKLIPLDLGTAAVNQELNFPGNVISFVSSTNLTDRISIRLDDVKNDAIPFAPGFSISGMTYDKLLISFAQVIGATAYLLVIDDPYTKEIRVG